MRDLALSIISFNNDDEEDEEVEDEDEEVKDEDEPPEAIWRGAGLDFLITPCMASDKFWTLSNWAL